MNDNEQYLESMRISLSSFEEGNLDLSQLITQLEIMFNGMIIESAEWKISFRQIWSVLEQVHSCHVMEGVALDSEKNTRLVKSALVELKILLDEPI